MLANLGTFAEISIALLGFSGLASALSAASRKNRGFLKIRLKALLIISGSACFGSLAPLTGLDLYYCCLAFALLIVGTVVSTCRDFLNTPDAAPSRILAVICIGWSAIAVIFQSIALALETDMIEVAYMFALSGTIAVSGLFFIRFVLALVQDLD